ncbi:MAG: glycosyltransferase [Rhodocyclales bacterium]|nr:glycosyltransferase [Rhodocyclales bacterium]
MHIIVGLEAHGAELMLQRLIEADPAAISSTVVVSLTSLGVIGESLQAKGVKVYALSMSSSLSSLVTIWRLVKLMRQYQPAIVQTWMYHADLLGGLAARLARCQNVVWGIRITFVPRSNMLTVLVMEICALISRWIPRKIICVADAARREHIKYGYAASRMVVIHNGFDFNALSATGEQIVALRQACHFAAHDVIVGWVGRYHPDKGQSNFVKAAAILMRSHAEVKFLLVGHGCDPSNSELMGWLTEYGLHNRFTLLGERSDVAVCLAAIDIFCMPSRNEGFPNVLGEAMAMGRPCVATNVGDAALLVGETAILVPPQDEQALAAGLSNILALSRQQREDMGQRAKRRVMAEFSIKKAHECFDSVYRELLVGEKF